MTSASLKIGWATADLGYDHPAFRRRFGHYAARRNVPWERANPLMKYDVVLVHHSADLTIWSRYDKGRVILDYNDDYLSTASFGVKAKWRGLAKYLTRQYHYLEFDYSQAYRKIMQRADAVVCSTDSQVTDVRHYCNNIHRIVDMQSDPEWVEKKRYQSGAVVNLVWEGLPALSGFQAIMPSLDNVYAKLGFALHLVTATKWPRYLNRYLPSDTKNKVDKVFPFKQVFIYEWNPILFSQIVTACDLALIPIPMRDPFWVGKPANKLLFFWRMGMPVLTSPTPEYSKAMSECGLDMTCGSLEDWEHKLEKYMVDENARREAGMRAKRFVDSEYSEEKLLTLWDKAFDSVL